MTDVAGYWAEGKIFGGVVIYDRGESELEVSACLEEPKPLLGVISALGGLEKATRVPVV